MTTELPLPPGLIAFLFALAHWGCALRLQNAKDGWATIIYFVTMVIGIWWIADLTGYKLSVYVSMHTLMFFAVLGVITSLIGFFFRGKGTKGRKKFMRVLLVLGSSVFALCWILVISADSWVPWLRSFEFSTKDLQTFWGTICVISFFAGLVVMGFARQEKDKAKAKILWVVSIAIMALAVVVLASMFFDVLY